MTLAWHPQALFIVFFIFFGLITVLVNYFTVRRPDQYPPASAYPFVSVLVPARNEARNIEACISSLLAQDYPAFEVIVLNDNSTDDTSLILERLAEANEHLRILKGAPLPEGWLGKHWACHQLDQVAGGELILFTDADTRHSHTMLRDSIAALLAEQADLLTLFPREEVVTWGERLLVPVIGWAIFTFIPIRLVQKLRWPALSLTIGQFMLFRKAAYETAGGYGAVRSEVVDDICLGRRVISNGGEWRLMNGTRHVACRMYEGFWDAVGGFSKSLFAVFDYRIIPYILGWLVVGVAFLEPVVALVSRWLRHPLTSMPVAYAALAVGLSIVMWMVAYRRFQFPAWLVFYYPLSLALFILVAARSLFQMLTGTATWKDRMLERAALRWL
jgi:chlorobactene glucosyltransferase